MTSATAVVEGGVRSRAQRGVCRVVRQSSARVRVRA